MVTCVNYGGLAAGSSCAMPGFCPPEYRAWLLTGPLIPSRPSRPTDPHISPRRAAAQTAPTATIIMALLGKVHTVVMEMHGCPPGFSGFLVALPFILQHAKKKERKGRECGCLCFASGGRGNAAHWVLSCYSQCKTKMGLKFMDHTACFHLLHRKLDILLTALLVE